MVAKPDDRLRPRDARTWSLVTVSLAVSSGPGLLWNVMLALKPMGNPTVASALYCVCQGSD